MSDAFILGAAAIPGERRPGPKTTTHGLLAGALRAALDSAGLQVTDVDGLGVSSFSLTPDRAIDLAWHLGLSLTWVMDDIVGMNLLWHAVRAVQAGDASTIVLLGGDNLVGHDFGHMVESYNTATRDYLAPLPAGGPNSIFSFVTQSHMAKYGLSREAYGRVVVSQRAWAGRNPAAIYREPLTMDEYLAAPLVSEPICLFDCLPLVAAAEAVVVSAAPRGPRAVRVSAIGGSFNYDHQEGDGLRTGLAEVAPALWEESGLGPGEIDVVGVYDDYPVMVLVQLEDLGFGTEWDEFLAGPGSRPAVNTSGGMLTAGQSGAGGGLHALVECVRQLRGERGEGQVAGARTAVVAGYGMVLYRYAACSVAAVLETA
jgi:acetyl-CoA acetyltransferase